MMKEVFVGSPIYMATEIEGNLNAYYISHEKKIINYNPYTADVFSVGIIILKLLSNS